MNKPLVPEEKPPKLPTPLSEEWWHSISAALLKLRKTTAKLHSREASLDAMIEEKLCAHKDRADFPRLCALLKADLLDTEGTRSVN